jgi:hypothetical protein
VLQNDYNVVVRERDDLNDLVASRRGIVISPRLRRTTNAALLQVPSLTAATRETAKALQGEYKCFCVCVCVCVGMLVCICLC